MVSFKSATVSNLCEQGQIVNRFTRHTAMPITIMKHSNWKTTTILWLGVCATAVLARSYMELFLLVAIQEGERLIL